MTQEEFFGSNPSESTGTVSFEELENAFKRPTQYQDMHQQPERSSDKIRLLDELPQQLVNPDGEDLTPADSEPVVDQEHALRTGDRIARLVDTGIDFALSNFVAKNGESYRADQRDLQDIAECWGELAQEKGWSIGPEMSLVILYVMVYGPLVKQAFTDRRLLELEERQKQIEERQRQVEEILEKEGKRKPQENKPDGTAEPNPGPFTHHPAEN